MSAEAAFHTTVLDKTRFCKFYLAGRCRRKQGCSFAHGPEELKPAPDFSRTKLCPYLESHGHCPHGPTCRYAHDTEELRARTPEYAAILGKFLAARAARVAAAHSAPTPWPRRGPRQPRPAPRSRDADDDATAAPFSLPLVTLAVLEEAAEWRFQERVEWELGTDASLPLCRGDGYRRRRSPPGAKKRPPAGHHGGPGKMPAGKGAATEAGGDAARSESHASSSTWSWQSTAADVFPSESSEGVVSEYEMAGEIGSTGSRRGKPPDGEDLFTLSSSFGLSFSVHSSFLHFDNGGTQSNVGLRRAKSTGDLLTTG